VFKAKRRTVVTVTAAAAVLLGGALAATLLSSGKGNDSASAGNTVQYKAGQRPLAPNLTGKSLTGTSINLDDYRGKVVVLNFWGSWCSPCRAEADDLAAASRELASEGVVFVGINTRDASRDNGRAFERTYDVPYPSIYDPSGSNLLAFHRTLTPNSIPGTVIIDQHGRVAASILGRVPTKTTLVDLVEDVQKS